MTKQDWYAVAFKTYTMLRLTDRHEECRKLAKGVIEIADDHAWKAAFDLEYSLIPRATGKIPALEAVAAYEKGHFENRFRKRAKTQLGALVLHAVYARALVYLGTQTSLDGALRLLNAMEQCLSSSMATAPEIAKWSVKHYRALVLDKLTRRRESADEYKALITEIQNTASSDDEGLATCVVVSGANLMATCFEEGRYDEGVQAFLDVARQRELARGVGNDDNNLAALFSFVVQGYEHFFSGSEKGGMRELVKTLLLNASKLSGEKDGIAKYNLAYATYQDGTASSRTKAIKLLGEAVEEFKSCPFVQERIAGALSSHCLSHALSDEGRKSPEWRRQLLKEGFAAEDVDGRRGAQLRVARSFLKHALSEHQIFFVRLQEELRHHHEMLARSRTIKNQDGFRVLRRWNSYTPMMPTTGRERGKGGGYFVSWKDAGLVIDPGPDFVELFLGKGCSLEDIDAVVVTHAHIDHLADLEVMLTLLHERNDLAKHDPAIEQRSVDIYLSEGAAIKCLPWLLALKHASGVIGHVRILNPGDEVRIGGAQQIGLQAMGADHGDIVTEHTSLGLKIDLRRASKKAVVRSIGITSDTRWYEGLVDQYSCVDLLVVHLGTVQGRELLMEAIISIPPKEFSEWEESMFPPDEVQKYYSYKHDIPLEGLKEVLVDRFEHPKEFKESEVNRGGHLGLGGVSRIAYELKPRILVVSEFGEELGYYRTLVAQVLQSEIAGAKGTHCFTGDTSFLVTLPGGGVWCRFCGKFVPAEEIVEFCDFSRGTEVVHACTECIDDYREHMLVQFHITGFSESALRDLMR